MNWCFVLIFFNPRFFTKWIFVSLVDEINIKLTEFSVSITKEKSKKLISFLIKLQRIPFKITDWVVKS